MNLTHPQITEINTFLVSPKLNLPPFRREISTTGANYLWLKKHIQKNNKNLPERLLELLGIEQPVTS